VGELAVGTITRLIDFPYNAQCARLKLSGFAMTLSARACVAALVALCLVPACPLLAQGPNESIDLRKGLEERDKHWKRFAEFNERQGESIRRYERFPIPNNRNLVFFYLGLLLSIAALLVLAFIGMLILSTTRDFWRVVGILLVLALVSWGTVALFRV
jgi:hypothetical protein